MKKTVLIIGGGHAGGMVAIYLRQKKFSGKIIIISEEGHIPYQRPPLSKAFLTDEIQEKQLYLKSQDYFIKHRISIEKNKKVIYINKEKNSVSTDNSEIYNYDFLVIATGSKLNYLNSSNNEDILYLKTIEDSKIIKDEIKKGKIISIIGGGYIGLELASICVRKKLKVRILESDARLMSRTVSEEIAHYIEDKYKRMNVDIKLNCLVKDIQKNNNHSLILCEDGSKYSTDLVFAGIGVKPNIGLAEKLALACDNGILVDHFGETSIKGIFAVGDCTSHPNSIMNKNVRLESVHNAIEQSKAVANKILGIKKPYNEVPYFWSDQHNLKLKIAGLTKQSNVHKMVSLDNQGITVAHFEDKRIICVESINRQKDFMLGRKLIKQQKKIPSSFKGKKFSSLSEIF